MAAPSVELGRSGNIPIIKRLLHPLYSIKQLVKMDTPIACMC